MKRYAQPIQVEAGSDGLPLAFRWRGQQYCVTALLDQWRIQTRWWLREEDRRYYQLVARPAGAAADDASGDGVYELCQRDAQWHLERVVD